MHERIEELMVEASNGACYDSNIAVLYDADIEKFAELIIKECMAQCADNGSNDEWDKGVRWAAEQIKQHFGVEE